ncbi:twin-arginine translocation signal domain-containing protein [Actinosynnema sp. ALI-1.44]|uniref:twin-arginine translocation signal domain-containing protein n=1 Tax=Actinosynnema sp. ALI-1.44 TaxID=1933779 RepID=UPI0009FFC8B6|nr:twin-arginine translocation signal domain-containing protein [Actinosynnema sp. ALI-1.44]
MLTRRTLLTTAAAGVAALGTGAPAWAAVTPVLTAPTGPHVIGRTDMHLVDRSRADPWLPDRRYRELMVSVWYPARDVRGRPRALYQPPLVAAEYQRQVLGKISPSALNWAGIRTHAHVDAPVLPGRRPLILFSPKHFEIRSYATLLAEELASRRYVVVTTEGTHEALAVEFPYGRLETVKPQSIPAPGDPVDLLDKQKRAVRSRADDLAFVLRSVRSRFDVSAVGAFGMVGGAVAAMRAAARGARIDAIAGMPEVVGPWVTDVAPVPFLQFAEPGNNHRDNPAWREFWPDLTGWKLSLRLTGSTWGSFCDYQALFPSIRAGCPDYDYGNEIGTIAPARSIAAQRAYLTAFFDLHLRGRDNGLLRGPSTEHPDVGFIV